MTDSIVFGIAARLGRFAHEVQALSAREVDGWLRFFNAQAKAQRAAANDDGDDAVDLRSLSPEQRRLMFPGR